MELTNNVNLIPLYPQQAAAEESGFLSLTQKTPSIADNSWIFKSLGLDDVVSGAVEKEISTVVSETDVIAAVLKEAVLPVHELSYSDLTAVSPSINASAGNFNNIGAIDEDGAIATLPANHAQNVTKVQNALDKALAFLDNLISNYNYRASAAVSNGQQMVKLTALLELRHAIKNCDMPIYIDYQSTNAAAYYSWQYIPSDPLNRHFERMIAFSSTTLEADNYSEKFLIGTILHEFTHSLHIPN
ncbi:MAG: hypothetical protein LBJ74_05370, partial [Heliobacteriaceae bacterium]|nr:hypothetical protein [Heliobacteriaceae bacterium]